MNYMSGYEQEKMDILNGVYLICPGPWLPSVNMVFKKPNIKGMTSVLTFLSITILP